MWTKYHHLSLDQFLYQMQDSEAAEYLKEHLDSLLSAEEVEELGDRITALEDEIDEKDDTIKELSDEISALEDEIVDLNKRIQELES